MIHVVAVIEVKDGMRDAFLAERRHLLPLVRAEVGCVEYVPSVDVPLSNPPKTPPRANAVIMHEKWETLPNLMAHAVAPHMNDFRTKTRHMVVSTKVEAFETV